MASCVAIVSGRHFRRPVAAAQHTLPTLKMPRPSIGREIVNRSRAKTVRPAASDRTSARSSRWETTMSKIALLVELRAKPGKKRSRHFSRALSHSRSPSPGPWRGSPCASMRRRLRFSIRSTMKPGAKPILAVRSPRPSWLTPTICWQARRKFEKPMSWRINYRAKSRWALGPRSINLPTSQGRASWSKRPALALMRGVKTGRSYVL